MPVFSIQESTFDLHRRAVMLDTNVLYAAFDENDQNHELSKTYLEMEEQYVVPLTVVIETWGMLVGRNRDWDAGLRLLEWIINPRSGAVVINHCKNVEEIRQVAVAVRIDCVDATILLLADEITRHCGYARGIRIATFDTADFLRAKRLDKFQFALFDMNSSHDIEFL